jgi:hypothetical protein
MTTIPNKEFVRFESSSLLTRVTSLMNESWFYFQEFVLLQNNKFIDIHNFADIEILDVRE